MTGKIARIAAGTTGLVALTGTTVALSGTAQAAQMATAATWHIVKSVRSGPTGDFSAVVATGRGSGWAFDGNPLAAPPAGPEAWKLSGTTWTRKPFPGKRNEGVVAAEATSRSNVWAFTDVGAGSRVLHWNGRKWSQMKTFSKPIGGASVAGAKDVWVFGQPGIVGQLGAWHYDGRRWSRVADNLDGGSALSASNVWAFRRTSVYHFNGHAWSHTNEASLLPRRSSMGLNDPMLSGIYAQSAGSVYAIGNGNAQDEGGPMVVLHYNGHRWRRVAEGSFGYGTQPIQQIAPDGRGGLWLPMPGFSGQRSYLLRYFAGKLTKAALPGAPGGTSIDVESVANVPGSTQMLGGGFTHAAGNPGGNVVGVILKYGS
jgi:hypothetical protein